MHYTKFASLIFAAKSTVFGPEKLKKKFFWRITVKIEISSTISNLPEGIDGGGLKINSQSFCATTFVISLSEPKSYFPDPDFGGGAGFTGVKNCGGGGGGVGILSKFGRFGGGGIVPELKPANRFRVVVVAVVVARRVEVVVLNVFLFLRFRRAS